MADVLMTWEIGQNYGHVLPLLPIAKALRQAGHRVTFALKDLQQVGPMVAAEGFALRQAPAHPDVVIPRDQPQPESMADILRLFGFDRPEVLRGYLEGWRTLMLEAATELVVASYAPVSLIAARTLGLRSALVGMAFELPPPVVPSPSFRPWLGTPLEALQRSEDAVVQAVTEVLRDCGMSVGAVHEIFGADRQLLWTFPELDPHADVRKAQKAAPLYCGPTFAAAQGSAAPWPERGSRKILGYLRWRKERLATLIEALAEVDAAFCLVVPGLDVDQAQRLQRANVAVATQPVDLRDALGQADALLSYGGHGTMCAALLAGKPMVLMPEQMESILLARQVLALGAAMIVDGANALDAANACRVVPVDARYKGAALRFQRRYQGYDAALQAGRIARVMHELLMVDATRS